ncbi:MAG: Mrp/NBP35 family ATP-binding protein [Erysipelotrichaceae bacterium]|nr:Mrp/NBP35 family ATP-binding protein [Erysipelotrichaceae bacterium]
MIAKENFKASFLAQPNPHSKIKKIFAIVSGKGGVGKSLITSLTAIELRRRGYRVGIMDADITGPSIPQIFNLHGPLYSGDDGIIPAETRTGIEVVSANLIVEDPTAPIIWRSPIITGLIKQFYSDVYWGELDYLLIDLPPGTGDVPLTVFQSIPLDGIIIVTTPQDLVSLIVEKARNMAEQMEIPVVGIVENMSYVICSNCGEKTYLFRRKNSYITDYEPIAQLPLNGEIAEMCDEGRLEECAVDYLDELIKELEKQS